MKVKRIIDVSRRINNSMAVWPGDKGVNVSRQASMKKGDRCNLSSAEMGLHTGTHVDAPLHFIDDSVDIAGLDLSKFIGFVKVFELNVKTAITAENLKGLSIDADDIVFFKTSNSEISEGEAFKKDFVYIEESAAEYLAKMGIKALGVDYLSIDGFGIAPHPAHKILLSRKVGIMEGLLLKGVEEGQYFFSCLPLKIDGSDGSPARAVLVEFE